MHIKQYMYYIYLLFMTSCINFYETIRTFLFNSVFFWFVFNLAVSCVNTLDSCTNYTLVCNNCLQSAHMHVLQHNYLHHIHVVLSWSRIKQLSTSQSTICLFISAEVILRMCKTCSCAMLLHYFEIIMRSKQAQVNVESWSEHDYSCYTALLSLRRQPSHQKDICHCH